jgi:hypothetical protein
LNGVANSNIRSRGIKPVTTGPHLHGHSRCGNDDREEGEKKSEQPEMHSGNYFGCIFGAQISMAMSVRH